MELPQVIVFFAGLFGVYVAAIKLEENIRLKKENKILKQKLGKE